MFTGCRWLTSIILATQEAEIRRIQFEATLSKSETLSQKYPTQKKGYGVTHVVKCLSTKYEAKLKP
jgi:hypothetical protein